MHNILEKEINLLLSQMPVSRFIGLAYQCISSFLHNKRNKALHKAVIAMDSEADIQCNILMQFEDSMLLYGVYNAEYATVRCLQC